MYLSITSRPQCSSHGQSCLYLYHYPLSPAARNNFEATSQTSYHLMHNCSCTLIFSLKKSQNPNKNCRKGSKCADGFSHHWGSDQAVPGLSFWRVCIHLLLLCDFGLAEAEGTMSLREHSAPVSGRRGGTDEDTTLLSLVFQSF